MATKLLKLLKGSIERGFTFQRSKLPLQLTGFVIWTWESVKDRRSTIEYSIRFSSNGPSSSWKCRKQQTVALFNCVTQYISLANAIQEANNFEAVKYSYRLIDLKCWDYRR